MEYDQKANPGPLKGYLKKITHSAPLLLGVAASFFVIAFLLNKYVVRKSSAEYYTLSLQNRIQQGEGDVYRLMQDTALLHRLAMGQYAYEELVPLLQEQKGYAFFLSAVDNGRVSRLLFWNSQTVDPPGKGGNPYQPGALVLKKNGYYLELSDYRVLHGDTVLFTAYLPVLHQYFVELENLRTEFDGFPSARNHIALSDQVTDYPVKARDGRILFYVKSAGNQERQPVLLIYFFIGFGVFFLIRLIQHLSGIIAPDRGPLPGVGFLLFSILLLRGLIYLDPFQLHLRQFELFDPGIYSTSLLLGSLGDLAINAFLFLWFAIHAFQKLQDYAFPVPERFWVRGLWVLLLLSVLVFIAFTSAGILQSLVTDAQISFNVTNFFSLSRYSFIGFLVMATLAVGFFLMAQILLSAVRAYTGGNAFVGYVCTAAAGLSMLTVSRNTARIELNLLVLIWLIGFILLLNRSQRAQARLRSSVSVVLFWLFFFSLSMAAVMIVENRKIEQQQRRLFAERLSQQAEPSNERLLSIALTYLDNDFLLTHFERLKDPVSNIRIKDSLINRNFIPYLNRFDTRIYTFDGSASPKPLFNEDSVSFETLNTIFNELGKGTTIPALRYFERSFEKYAYIFRKQVFAPKDSIVTGYLFVLAEPRRYKYDALVPALFRQNRESLLPEYSGLYSYAIYSGGELIDHFNEYEFATHLDPQQLPRMEYEIRRRSRFVELWYRKNPDNVVVVVRKDNYLLEAITFFAYFFTTFLLLIVCYALLRTLWRARFRWRFIRERLRLTIRNQIHSTIILVSLFSFTVIGISTIVFYVNRYNANNQERLSRMMQIIVNQVQNTLQDQPLLQYGLNNPEGGTREELEQLMQEISEIHGNDVNLYDTLGHLIASSRPIVYNKGVLSPLMNPDAWYRLRQLDAIQTVKEEHMGKLNYLSIYNPLRNSGGRVQGFINVPSYSSQAELKQEISNFLLTLINLNAFIFLVAGALALIITNRITYSFTLIGRKMRDIHLGRMNQEIEWSRNDEIGSLVNEYNKMVEKLDESVAILAKSEREGAWRQMARQVAHEIKNPLTPMKLSIQYLQKAIDGNSVNVKEMTAKVANTLVEQIDHLSKIASDFSQFANIGEPRNEVFDLHEVLYSLTLLYGATTNLDFQWQPVHQRVMVFADKTQMNRLFTNLLQNAVEATAQKAERRVRLVEELDGSYIQINVIDNGEGISEQVRTKIFTPNFTTKSSGTGLGLAMCKSIVENARGEILFETVDGEGTTFWVRIPMFT